MTQYLPDAGTFAAYTLACLVLFITPGPDMSLFLAKTVAGGRAAGMAAMFGALLGTCVHSTLAALGLSALLAASPFAFTILKVVGAVYLLWLAIDAIRNGSALNVRGGASAPAPIWRTFLLGLLVNLLNPKIILFFVTFLPQFLDPGDTHAAGKLLLLGLYFVALSAPLGVGLILCAERTIGFLKARPRAMRGIDYVFAAIFGAFAARIAFTVGR